MILKIIFLFQLVVVFAIANVLPRGKESPGKRKETLDKDGKFIVYWQVYTDVQTVFFEITVETHGFIGFGISPVGGMNAADIIIGGVHQNGTAYFSDRHGTGNTEPAVDEPQNWVLLTYSQNGTHTSLNVARLLNTCDDQDASLGNDTTNFIWSFGATDDIQYHGSNRGTFAVNPLDPPMPPFDSSQFRLWRMTSDMVMPSQKTTYWCTVQKSPLLTSKHHIVGFRPLLETANARKHTHHFVVHKCVPPAGSSAEETFEHLVGQPGGECYGGKRFSEVPMEYCRVYIFVWGVGGRRVIYPDHVGYPVGVNGETNYYLLEVHYNNPDQDENLRFETGLELFYTSQIRQYDAGTIVAGHETKWTMTIPPKSENFTIVGHCAPACSNKLPQSGIKIFNVLLHSHLAGRKMKVRHFRGDKELPWMAVDNNYNFDYQQNRPLVEERIVLPGDHLTYECVYNSMTRNGSTIGGLSTTDEMCLAFLWYYPDVGMGFCGSEFPKARLMAQLGIQILGGQYDHFDPIISAPPEHANKTYTEYLDTVIPWTPANRSLLQQELRYGAHNIMCLKESVSDKTETETTEGSYTNVCRMKSSGKSETETKETAVLVTYPDIKEPYEPMDQCRNIARH